MRFYKRIFVTLWVLKILCLKKRTFVNILEKLLLKYIVLSGKDCLGLNIWPKTSYQDLNTKDMIIIIWHRKTIKQKKFYTLQ